MHNKVYRDLHISFPFENCSVTIINVLYGKFDHSIPPHSHANDCYEIHLIASGYGQLLVNNIRYDLIPGSLFITGPNINHEQVPVFPDSMVEYCIYSEVKRKKNHFDTNIILDRLIDNPFLFGNDNGKILEIMKEIFRELDTKALGYQKQVELLFSTALINMMRGFMQDHALQNHQTANISPETTPLSEQTRSTLIEDAFMTNYNTISLTDLATLLCLSRRQTERLIQKLYGKTFQEKKLEARMSAASLMLKSNKLSITDIAEATGYSTQEYFSNSFRKYYGYSPRQYRLQNTDSRTP